MDNGKRIKFWAEVRPSQIVNFNVSLEEITHRNDNILEISPGAGVDDDDTSVFRLLITREEASLLVLRVGCTIMV